MDIENMQTHTVLDVSSGIQVALKVIQIGGWNMDTTANVSIAHGLNFANILCCMVKINHDNGTIRYDFPNPYNLWNVQGSISWDATNINLARLAGGAYDSVNFDDAINRGTILVFYTL